MKTLPARRDSIRPQSIRPRSIRPRSIRPARVGRAAAFTLVELLIVIGIIAVLVAILLPTLSKVRERAYEADSRAQISSLEAVIQAYYGDFSAYPGPIPYSQIYTSKGTALTAPAITAAPKTGAVTADRITMSENLVLGLLGGLRPVSPQTTPPTFTFDGAAVGQGPASLGTLPKKNPPYGDMTDLKITSDTAGNFLASYEDSNSTKAEDSVIPEFVDRFPEAMPLLYMRARNGARSAANTADDNPVVTTQSRVGQYDLSQIFAYIGDGTDPAKAIGAGKKVKTSEIVGAGVKPYAHGLTSVDPTSVDMATPHYEGAAYTHPYNLYYALRDFNVKPPAAASPKRKDTYILISAGIDRIYGTSDDITNFGGY